MTEQEAEILATRLERIWVPESQRKSIVLYSGNGSFSFSAEIEEGVSFDCSQNNAPTLDTVFGRRFGLLQHPIPDHDSIGRLWWYGQFGDVRSAPFHNDQETIQLFKPFVARWTPFFRRGCWLSGLPVEASAHEKAEWIQGFSREEVEAWNLKM